MTESLDVQTDDIVRRVERFVRSVVAPFENDPRRDHHGAPTDELVADLRALAKSAEVLTPHIFPMAII